MDVLGNEVTLMRIAEAPQAVQGRGVRDRAKREQTLLSYLTEQERAKKPMQQASAKPAGLQTRAQRVQTQQTATVQVRHVSEAQTQQLAKTEERRVEELREQGTDPVSDLVIAMGGTEEARQLVLKALAYLSRYPSVGVIRFVDDVSKLARARREQVSRLLDAMRSLGIVDVVDGAVVNLKKKIDVKVRLGI